MSEKDQRTLVKAYQSEPMFAGKTTTLERKRLSKKAKHRQGDVLKNYVILESHCNIFPDYRFWGV